MRPLEERDLDPLSRDLGLGRDHILQRWEEHLAARDTMQIAEVGGRLAGSICVEERGELPGLLYAFALQIAPGLQNRGIGSAVMAWVEEEAARRGLAGVIFWVAEENTGARRLYERLGYEPDGLRFGKRWLCEGPDGEQREVVETVQRMLKRFDQGAR